jgi:hypothetical protein
MKRLISSISVLILISGAVVGQVDAATDIQITKADIEKAGTSIPVSFIGEPVGSVKLYPARWVEASGAAPAYGVIEGSIFPVDPEGWPINFRVVLPAGWSRRAVQQGGGGMNGVITVREANNPFTNRGFAVYGSDSGHQGGFGGGGTPLATGPKDAGRDDWALNEEAIRNLGYMQMKKTHDAAMVIIERIYGEKPLYNYWVGGSQGGREGLTVAQRYPTDYDGIIADVPIVNFSTLMLAPELIRIQEKPLANWVTPAKVNAIRAEFLRQCDGLDGLSDGIINNYMAARAIFDVTDDAGPEDPWQVLRAPGVTDPDPADNSVSAKLTEGQIKTLEMEYSPYKFKRPLANGVISFGMWLPTISPDEFGMITGTRFKGQEGVDDGARLHISLGTLGVTGFLMQDVNANPLDYHEDERMLQRRSEISEWLDATDPDLTDFCSHGGKIIMTIGTMDLVASSGAQLDYYKSVIEKMGNKVDEFARMYVVPQAGHGLSGRSSNINGDREEVEVRNIPAPDSNDKFDLLLEWVEEDQAPPKTLVISPQGHISIQQDGLGYLLCSYPCYPKYTGGPADEASSYICASF